MTRSTLARLALCTTLALGIAGCSSEQPKDYKTDVVDKSGGELIVEDAKPEGVEVKLPETPMTNAPEQPKAAEAPKPQ